MVSTIMVIGIQVFYSNSSSAVKVDGTIGILQSDILAPFLSIILVTYLLDKASGPDSELVTCPRQSKRYLTNLLNDLDFADDIASLES